MFEGDPGGVFSILLQLSNFGMVGKQRRWENVGPGFIRHPFKAVVKVFYCNTRFSLGMEMSRRKRGGTAEPVSRDQILGRKRGQGIIRFPCSADHEQDWQPYPVDPYSCYM